MRTLWAAVALALLPTAGALGQWSGEARVRRDTTTPNSNSASVLGNTFSDEVPGPERSTNSLEANLRGRVSILNVDAHLRTVRTDGGDHDTFGRFKELYALVPAGDARLSAGRRVVEWDVGFGFRPNDLVQQDTVQSQRRELLSTKPIGRYLLQSEFYAADASASLAWVNPQRLNAPIEEQRGVEESALAMMAFQRRGSVDIYGFGRLGRRTGLSLGGAFASVLTDTLSVYGSARVLRRHDGWSYDAAPADTLLSTTPWRQITLGYAKQMLVGASWTGQAQQGVLVEWWYDGTTLSDGLWRAWQSRKETLTAQGRAAQQGDPNAGPLSAIGPNLGWQDLPLSVLNQRRQTVLVRLSWQPQPWLFFVDALFNPADSGRNLTAGVQWQGDTLRLDAAMRWFGGPDYSLAAQLPDKRQGLVAMTWSY